MVSVVTCNYLICGFIKFNLHLSIESMVWTIDQYYIDNNVINGRAIGGQWHMNNGLMV